MRPHFLKDPMHNRQQFIGIADIIALLTWALVFGITLSLLPSATETTQQRTPLIVFLFVLYIVCFFIATRDSISFFKRPMQIVAVIVQLGCAFGLLLMLRLDYLPILTIIWCAVIAHYLPMRYAIIVTLAVVVSWFSLYAWLYDSTMWLTGLLYGCFHMFALMSHVQIVRENQAKEALQMKHQELLATQHLLSEASKTNERHRIARDLHDVVGHHLTALTINLQVASLMSEGEVKEKVEQSHSIAKLLLSEVREAISDYRNSNGVELEPAIVQLLENVPKLNTHWQIESGLDCDNVEVAQTCLRLVQESLTNTLKHSKATDYYLTIESNKDHSQILIKVRDNGRASASIRPGHGINGMLERVDSVGGNLEYHTDSGHMVLYVTIPINGLPPVS